ncbi:MAG: adenosylmethionine--8-amino-7-oxononanoate transaminase [Myxococcota bacterium]|nr:adenosylmethionine--8-amino-7-oxononanoate transaminase [Myxococcota bacterium]
MTTDLKTLDQRHIWHPFTHHGIWGSEAEPIIIIDRAEGNEIIDIEGKRYLDAISSLWCNTLGHRVEKIDAAIRDQLDKIAHSTLLGLAGTPSIELATRLAAICPGDLNRTFFSDAGATSVEIALKIAVQYSRLKHDKPRTKILSLAEAYHGDTMGSVSLGYSSWFHRHFDHLVFDVQKLPHNIEGSVKMIQEAGDELCAVIIEPLMQGAAGMITQPNGYVKAVADACQNTGGLFIADEVATGFWRTGRRFAVDHENVVPDILCLAKGLSGGYLPMAATVVRDHVFEPFSDGQPTGEKTFFHGHTFTGNALGCAASSAALEALEEVASTGRVQEMIEILTEALEPFHSDDRVVEIRQRGLMVGLELRHSDSRDRVAYRVAKESRNRGVLLRPLGTVMVLMPPFSFSNEDLLRTVQVMKESMDAIM